MFTLTRAESNFLMTLLKNFGLSREREEKKAATRTMNALNFSCIPPNPNQFI